MNSQLPSEKLIWLRAIAADAEAVGNLAVVEPASLLVLIEIAEAAAEEHGNAHHEPECPLCVAVNKLGAL